MRLLSLIGLIVATSCGAGPDEPRPGAEAVLFDGHSLDGWRPLAGARVGKVAAEGGTIALAVGDPMTGVTCTRPALPTVDYSLSYEAKRTAGNDFFAAATFPVGDSFITLVNGGWGGSVTGLSLVDGASAAENPTNHFVKYQNDVWYSFQVQVTRKVIRCLVDGREVFAFDHRDAQLKTRLENRPNQPLGFASYRSAGSIRQIRVAPLGATEVAQADARIGQD